MANSEDILFPPIEPYHFDRLPVSKRHSIYYEQCGNPQGKPVLVLHGGPGSGCTPAQRRFFDSAYYRIILTDQRGCKRSLPLGCTDENTTADLVADIEVLRQHLGISDWLVFGGSWGSTLALAYAYKHPASINGMILRGIFLCRPAELNWFLYQVQQFFPAAWDRFVAILPPIARQDILNAYYHLIFSDDRPTALNAAKTWSNFEAEIMSLLPASGPTAPAEDAFVIARARVQLHYLVNGGFIDAPTLLSGIDRVRHIPTIIIQGRYDMVCPPITAYELHQAWPEAKFEIVPDAGHSAMDSGIARALTAATKAFASPHF